VGSFAFQALVAVFLPLDRLHDCNAGSCGGAMKLTRTQQRQMKKLACHVARATDTDRVFFEQHPDRKHRVRFASEVEIARCEIVSGEVMTLPPGFRHFVIVRNVAPGHRVRLFVTNAEDAGTDVPEDLAGAIFDKIAGPHVREIEAALPAASPEEGGAA
jgi:hypothetical protein